MDNRRIVLIVGGTGGIGTYLIQAFVGAGYNVIFTYNANKERADELESKYNCKGLQADSSRELDIERVKDFINESFGRLDALVYATGIFEDSLAENMSIESWDRVLSVNLTGAFLYSKVMIALLRRSGKGRLVCIGSVMGESGIYGSCSYSAAKAGMIGLVKSLALENARYGVTANVVSFGYIDAGMTKKVPEGVLASALKKIPMKCFGDPMDAAKVVVDVCAEHASYVTGQVIRNNGGIYI